MNPPIHNSNSILLLERLFNTVQNTTSGQACLVGFFDYVEYVLKNPITKAVIDDLEKQKTATYKTYYQLREKAKIELKKSKNMLLAIISKNDIKNKELDKTLQELEHLEDKNMSMGGIYEQNLENLLFEICLNFVENKQLDLVKHFIDDNKKPQNIFGNFVFSQSLSLFNQEEKRINNLKKIELWPYWYSFKFVPEISRILFSEVLEQKTYLPEEEIDYYFNYLHLHHEVDSKAPSAYQKDLFQFKDYLTRLHNYFMQKLNEAEVNPIPFITSQKLDFYPADGTAQYKGVNYTFPSGTKAYELLNLLFTSKNSPLELNYFQEGCNDNIRIEKNKFKTNKDVLDTISHIKRKLEVNKGEYFPIFKSGKCFIWQEK